MASLVLSHLMNGIVCGVHAGSLSVLGNTELVFASATLSSDTSLKVALSILQHVTQQLSKLLRDIARIPDVIDVSRAG